MHIVYVEDDDDNAFMLSRRLQRLGHEVTIASDGLSGLDTVRNLGPDIVLMDLGLPGLDGWEVTRRLKSDPSTRAIPVIAVSSHAMQGDRESAIAAGCDDYDTKPVDFGRLMDKINACLRERSS